MGFINADYAAKNFIIVQLIVRQLLILCRHLYLWKK